MESALLVLFAFLGWYWYDSMRARERALGLSRAACARDGLQLLDDTVQCVRLRFARDKNGRLRLQRTYRFEFSDTGFNRRGGSIVLCGTQVESLYLEPFLVQ
ncbi:MAG: DUF3301 domain-containing protein [Burkholderiales bacterium]|nr:DUF3301 domain-containing protein [Burkholderiales bacterium]